LGALCAPGCKSQGEELVDQLVATVAHAELMVGQGQEEVEPAGALAAVAYLEERALQMRISESRLDDFYRTLNPARRAGLKRYAEAQIDGLDSSSQ
jgi:hypothetical protein